MEMKGFRKMKANSRGGDIYITYTKSNQIYVSKGIIDYYEESRINYHYLDIYHNECEGIIRFVFDPEGEYCLSMPSRLIGANCLKNCLKKGKRYDVSINHEYIELNYAIQTP